MSEKKWIVHPGETRVIEVDDVSSLKVGLVRGQVDVIGHDEAGVRIEVHDVTAKDLRIELDDDELEIDHPQLRWDNVLEVFRNVGANAPRAEISVAVPRAVLLNLGVVSAGALVAGLSRDAKVNTVSGDVLVDGLSGDLSVNTVSGDVQVRGLSGAFDANSVSGDLAVTGDVRKATVDAVSATTLIDASGPVASIAVNGVSGSVTVRLDDGYPANYVARSASGKVLVDGAVRSASGPTAFTGAMGELSDEFADVRVNTVSGDITVLRRNGIRQEAQR